MEILKIVLILSAIALFPIWGPWVMGIKLRLILVMAMFTIGCSKYDIQRPCPKDFFEVQYSQEQGAYVGVKAYKCSKNFESADTNRYWAWYDADENGIPCDRVLSGSGERKACEDAGYFRTIPKHLPDSIFHPDSGFSHPDDEWTK